MRSSFLTVALGLILTPMAVTADDPASEARGHVGGIVDCSFGVHSFPRSVDVPNQPCRKFRREECQATEKIIKEHPRARHGHDVLLPFLWSIAMPVFLNATVLPCLHGDGKESLWGGMA